jgi:RNA polymerase sigma-70 factor (ECF subfamily)
MEMHGTHDAGEITRLLEHAATGDQNALDALSEKVYADLERVAARRLRHRFGPELAGVTLEPAALVNETFLKLLATPMRFANRRHFFAFATRVMLRALTDYQRARGAAKRGGDATRVSLSGLGAGASPLDTTAEMVSSGLAELEELDPRKAEVVALKVFWGFEMMEIAEALEVSLRTVERDWRFARNWLRARLQPA